MGSYTKKAVNDLGDKAHELGRNGEEPDYDDYDDSETETGALRRGIDNRQKGITRAVNKITKEEVELTEDQKSDWHDKDSSWKEHHKHISNSYTDYFDKDKHAKHLEKAKKIEHKVRAKHGDKVADDMVKHSDAVVGSFDGPDGGRSEHYRAKAYRNRHDIVDHDQYDHNPDEHGHIKEEAEQIDELSKDTLGRYVTKASLKAAGHAYNNNTDKAFKRLDGIKTAVKKLTKEEAEQEMSPYLKATLSVMDEGKVDDLRDAQALRKANTSAYSKDYKQDDSHPAIKLVKGNKYGGSNQSDDESDEKKPDDEKQEKRGRGRPHGSKSGARTKGTGKDDESGGIQVHNLNLPNRSNKY
jgi:hypothetical protein